MRQSRLACLCKVPLELLGGEGSREAVELPGRHTDVAAVVPAHGHTPGAILSRPWEEGLHVHIEVW
eukprot:4467531-Lingulodinium_polyedra.AAC.1